MTTPSQSELAPLVGETASAGVIVGARTLVLGSVGSTNLYAAQLARKGEFVEGQAIFADRQTDGRGRMGRTWHCPDGAGLLLSVILTPQLDTDRLPAITAIGALAAAEVVERMTSASAQIRWPNDVVVEGAKIAGVLARIEKNTRRRAVLRSRHRPSTPTSPPTDFPPTSRPRPRCKSATARRSRGSRPHGHYWARWMGGTPPSRSPTSPLSRPNCARARRCSAARYPLIAAGRPCAVSPPTYRSLKA